MQLPDGFSIERRLDGWALILDGGPVAYANPVSGQAAAKWRVTIIPAVLPRYEFVAGEAQALGYIAAWARKWEREIREVAARHRASPMGAQTSPHAPDPPPTKHPRRRPRRPW